MNARRSLAILASATLIAACQPPDRDLDADGEALMQLSRDWSDLAGTGSLETVMSYWADDAVMLPPDMPALEGKAAIRGFVETARQLPGFAISWEPLSVHVASGGDMAYMIERNVTTVHDSLGNPVTTHGKVVTIWRRDAGGRWKNVVDMWNSAPPPGQPVTAMDMDRLRQFAAEYTAAWGSQDPASVASFFSETGSLTINAGEPAVGRQAITDAAQGFMTAFPDLIVDMDEVVLDGPGAVYRWTLTGTNTGPGGTGNAVRISGHEEWTFDANGLIAESRGHFDEAEYRRQLDAGVALD